MIGCVSGRYLRPRDTFASIFHRNRCMARRVEYVNVLWSESVRMFVNLRFYAGSRKHLKVSLTRRPASTRYRELCAGEIAYTMVMLTSPISHVYPSFSLRDFKEDSEVWHAGVVLGIFEYVSQRNNGNSCYYISLREPPKTSGETRDTRTGKR